MKKFLVLNIMLIIMVAASWFLGYFQGRLDERMNIYEQIVVHEYTPEQIDALKEIVVREAHND